MYILLGSPPSHQIASSLSKTVIKLLLCLLFISQYVYFYEILNLYLRKFSLAIYIYIYIYSIIADLWWIDECILGSWHLVLLDLPWEKWWLSWWNWMEHECVQLECQVCWGLGTFCQGNDFWTELYY